MYFESYLLFHSLSIAQFGLNLLVEKYLQFSLGCYIETLFKIVASANSFPPKLIQNKIFWALLGIASINQF